MNTREITNKYLGLINGWAEGSAASDAFWSTYESEKAKKLKDLFGGKLIIEKEIAVEKRIDDIRDDIEEKELGKAIKNALAPEFQDILNRRFHWNTSELSTEEQNDKKIRDIIVEVFLYNRGLACQEVRDNYAFVSPVTNKTIKLQRGSKISKALKHFITDPQLLEQVQVLYSQILNDKMLRGTLCLSIHPLDYLTASVNEAGWDSCYNTLAKNCWCASTLSLVTSPNTMMVYLKSKNDGNYGWGSNTVEWNSKKWRCFATLSDNNELVHIGRNYPYENLGLMKLAKEMIMELTGHTYGEIGDSRDVVIIDTPENMYNDAECGDIYTCMTEKYELSVPVFGREHIHISPVGAVCPTCGDRYDDCEFDVQCSNCGDHRCCADCGDTMNDDDSYWIERGDYYVCSGCIDSYYYCDNCGEYHEDDDVVEYAHYWSERHEFYNTDYICRSCLDRSSDIHECPTCQRLVVDDASREDGTCFKCEPIGVPSEF